LERLLRKGSSTRRGRKGGSTSLRRPQIYKERGLDHLRRQGLGSKKQKICDNSDTRKKVA